MIEHECSFYTPLRSPGWWAKIDSACCGGATVEALVGQSRSAVLAGRRAGLVYDHGGQVVQLRFQPVPDPHRQDLGCGILESGDVVQIVVIELIVDRLERLLDV